MKMINSFDPTAASSGQFDPLVANPCGRIYLFNESAIGLQLTFQDGSVAALPPYYFRSYILHQPGIVKWKQAYSIATGASPLSVVVGEAYESAEAKGIAWTEGPLNRQTSIGNSIPVNTAVTTLTNDGNAVNTTVVEATQTGSAGSNALLDNSGNFTLKQWVGASLTTLFQVVANASTAVLIGAAGKLAEVVGSLQVDQNLTVKGSSSLDNGTMTTNGAGGLASASLTTGAINSGNITSSGNIVFTGKKLGISAAGDLLDAATVATQVNLKTTGGDLVLFQGSTEIGRFTNGGNLRLPGGLVGVVSDGDLIDASGAVDTYIKTRSAGGNVNIQVPNGSTRVSVGAGGLIFNGTGIQWKTGDTTSGIHSFTGTTTGTYTHGAGGSPFIVIPMTQVSGSQTMGYDSVTSTQVHITSASGLSFKALTLLG